MSALKDLDRDLNLDHYLVPYPGDRDVLGDAARAWGEVADIHIHVYLFISTKGFLWRQIKNS